MSATVDEVEQELGTFYPFSPQHNDRYDPSEEGAGIFGAIQSLSEVLPVSRATVCDSSEMTNLSGLPDAVTHLTLVDCVGLTSLNGLREDLGHLNILSCTNFKDLSYIPPQLKSLIVLDCLETITALGVLPESLEDLYMTDCPAFASARLPSGLKRLFVSYSKARILPPLPAGLLKFAVYASKVSQLPTLPEGLVTLSLTACDELMELHLPNSLRYLHIEQCRNIRTLPELPAGLRVIRAHEHLLAGLPEMGRKLRYEILS